MIAFPAGVRVWLAVGRTEASAPALPPPAQAAAALR